MLKIGDKFKIKPNSRHQFDGMFDASKIFEVNDIMIFKHAIGYWFITEINRRQHVVCVMASEVYGIDHLKVVSDE